MSPTFRLAMVTLAAVTLTMICCFLFHNLIGLLLSPVFFAYGLIVAARIEGVR